MSETDTMGHAPAPAASALSPAVRIGRRWFKWRSISPLPLFLLLVVLPPDFVPSSGLKVSILLGICLTEILRIWAVGYAGSATRTRGDTVPALVHSGPFRYLRNPLYVANIFMYTLCGVLFGFTFLSFAIFVYSCVQYHFIVAFEEETLARSFGRSYKAYQRAVPRWWPSLSPQCSASDHQFDLGRALRSERSTFFSMLLMMVLYFLKIKFGN